MEWKHIFGVGLLLVIWVVLVAGLWILGMILRRRKLRHFAIVFAVVPLIGICIQFVFSWSGWDRPIEYRTIAVGPASSQQSVRDELRVPVTAPNLRHDIEMVAKPSGDERPAKPIRLRFELKSPQGETLVEGDQELSPGTGPRWSMLQTHFLPLVEGEHTLFVDVPNPVGNVDIIVREVRR